MIRGPGRLRAKISVSASPGHRSVRYTDRDACTRGTQGDRARIGKHLFFYPPAGINRSAYWISGAVENLARPPLLAASAAASLRATIDPSLGYGSTRLADRWHK